MLQMSQDKGNWIVITHKHISILTSNRNNSSLQRWQIPGPIHRAALCRRVLCVPHVSCKKECAGQSDCLKHWANA